MSRPKKATLERRLRELRVLVTDPKTDEVTARIAQAMETAIRWATENTVGWPRPAREAIIMAEILRREL